MWYNRGNIVSVNDFMRDMCLSCPNKGSITPFIDKFCYLVFEHVNDGDLWYTAEAKDNTKHILMDIDNIVNTFFDSRFESVLQVHNSFFDPAFTDKQFYNLQPYCFLSQKRLKREIKEAEKFSDFVKTGPIF